MLLPIGINFLFIFFVTLIKRTLSNEKKKKKRRSKEIDKVNKNFPSYFLPIFLDYLEVTFK